MHQTCWSSQGGASNRGGGASNRGRASNRGGASIMGGGLIQRRRTNTRLSRLSQNFTSFLHEY